MFEADEGLGPSARRAELDTVAAQNAVTVEAPEPLSLASQNPGDLAAAPTSMLPSHLQRRCLDRGRLRSGLDCGRRDRSGKPGLAFHR